MQVLVTSPNRVTGTTILDLENVYLFGSPKSLTFGSGITFALFENGWKSIFFNG